MELSSFRFMLNGEEIDPNTTCEIMGLKDNDEIDCFLAAQSDHHTHTHPEYPYVLNDDFGQVKRVLKPRDVQKEEIEMKYRTGGCRDSTGGHWYYEGAVRLNLEDPESVDLQYLGRLNESSGEFEYDKNNFKGIFEYEDRDLPSNQHWFRGKLRKDPFDPIPLREQYEARIEGFHAWKRSERGEGMPTNKDEIRALTEEYAGMFNAAELRSIFSTLMVDQFNHGRVLEWDDEYRRGIFRIRKQCMEQITGQRPYCGRMRILPVAQSATLLIDNRNNQKFLSVIYHFSHEHQYSFRARSNSEWPWKEKYRICITYSPLPVSMSDYIEKHHGKGKVEVTMKDVKQIEAKFMRCKSRVEVSFDYIEFLQCSMEWGDPLHACAWKKLCEVEVGRSMTKEEILNTPQAIQWGSRPYFGADGKRSSIPPHLQKTEQCAQVTTTTNSSVEHIKAMMIQAVWRSFHTRNSKMPSV